MKKFGLLLLVFSLVFGMYPQDVLAAEIFSFDQELSSYLNNVSSERGFDVTQEVIDKSLAAYSKSTSDFTTVNDISSLLGKVIKADNSNLTDIYSKYTLDQASLEQLLSEYGEGLEDYIFIHDLDTALALYVKSTTDTKDTTTGNNTPQTGYNADLVTYLANISTIRGFDISIDAVNAYLAEYDMSTADFISVEELDDYLGDVIKSDLSNLDYFITNYDMDQQAVLQLIEDNGKNINDYIYLDQIEELVWSSYGGSDLGIDPTVLLGYLEQLGLSQEELLNLQNHFMKNEEYFSSAEVQSKIEELITRMLTFVQDIITKGEADSNYKMNDTELKEFVSFYEELLSLAKLKAVFRISQDGVDKAVSIFDLMKLEEEEMLNKDLKVAIYNSDSELLADFIVTSDFINDNLSDIIEDVNNSAEGNQIIHTMKGGKLPKTASNDLLFVLLGLFITTLGFYIYRKVRNDKSEIIQDEV